MAVRKRGRRGGRASSQRGETPNVGGETRAEGTKGKSERALVVAQEIKIARLLANNDKKVRDKVLKRVKKWLTVRSQSSFEFTRADFMNLWKGLFYCMWMSDKMLIQEELAESLSKLVHCLNSMDAIVLYTSCALWTISKEWFGIDQYRLDKFSMLVRRILRQSFVVCKNQSWDMKWVMEICRVFRQLFLNVDTGIGFNLHMTEIYLEELAKVSNGDIPEDVVHEFIKPFADYLIHTHDERQMKHIMRHVFRYLIFQSDVGLNYMEKFNAWKGAGFPCTRIDDMQEIEMSDAEENSNSEGKQFPETVAQNETEKPLDPRAGRVNVELPQIPFNAAKIVKLLTEYTLHPSSTARSRRQVMRLLEEYKELAQGRMPLGIKRVRKLNSYKKETDSRKAALRLIKFEKNMLSDQVKKRKRENEKTVCNEISINDPKKGDASALESNADSESELINTTATAKADLEQNTDADTVPLKKLKRSDSTCDISSTKFLYENGINVENTRKLKKKLIENSKKSKVEKVKLNQKNNKSTTEKNVKRKTKKAVIRDVQTSGDADQCVSISPICSIEIPSQETNNKSVAKKTKSKIKHKPQETPLKNKLSRQTKKQTNLNNFPLEKKKVMFGLSRNTAHHTSEYLQQLRKSPGIPFDANKKPLASVLKMSPIPSPLNPFYKKCTK
ncbi:PREDICTED: ribosomal RNA processing protein 1 homolog [Vollenhovia emeryi]|uniref:ribosomal RNA processing protein 1 homolog n=1 Tax=Vollenhovia emeryi TaxID=411798 RepID=UPI0005F3D97D|nr:PREDICTED: ribosomal RNA processing protein 1 homolog [Vollenhovia emeryi]